MTRYRQDAAYELGSIENRIASARKSAYNTTNRTTAAIADAVLPSLERRREELLLELQTLPERPPRSHADMGGSIQIGRRDHVREPLTDEEIAGLEIPSFLRRVA